MVYETNRVIVTTKSNGGTQPSLGALSTITGSLVQSWSYGDITMGLGGATNGTLYVGASSGKLYEFDQVLTRDGVDQSLRYGDEQRIVAWMWEDWDQRGRLYFSTTDGHVWAVQRSGLGAPTGDSTSGWLYAPTANGKIWAVPASLP